MSLRTCTVYLARLAVCLLLGGAASLAVAQQPQPDKGKKAAGRVERRTYDFKEAGKPMEYALFVPSSYDSTTKAPLIVALHGMGGNPQQILRARGLTDLAEKHGYIVVAPMGFNNSGWYGIKMPSNFGKGKFKGKFGKGKFGKGEDVPANFSELSEKDVLNVLALVRKEFNIDAKRIYLIGHSMGGGGALHLGMKYPDLWAGLAPIAPAAFAVPMNLDKIKHIPVVVVQGDADTLVRPEGTRRWVTKMKELGITHEYVEIAGGGHGDVISRGMPRIFEFFEKHRPKADREK